MPKRPQRTDFAYIGTITHLHSPEAVHRCLAAGLCECPRYGKAESLHAMDLLTRIQRARHA